MRRHTEKASKRNRYNYWKSRYIPVRGRNIARAILKDAPIVVLDEATAYADPENEHQIQKAFDGLIKNKTVIMVAHRLSTVQDADQILVMKNGAIAESGTHSDLIKHQGEYAKMWDNYNKTVQWHIES